MHHIIYLLLSLSICFAQQDIKLTPAQKGMQIKEKNQKILQVSQKGMLITLVNGKKYRVHDGYTNIAGGWLIPSKIKLYKTEDPNTYILENLNTQTKIRVSPY